MTNYTVNSSASFASALTSIAGNSAGNDTVTFTASFAITESVLREISKTGSGTLTIDGAGFEITSSTVRPFFIESGNVSISNLTVSHAAAQGGGGGSAHRGGGGGGGLGAGGAIFVGSTANVTLTSVTLADNSATGGQGGTADGANISLGGGGGGGLQGNGADSGNGSGGGGGGFSGNGGAGGVTSSGGGGGGGFAGNGGSGPHSLGIAGGGGGGGLALDGTDAPGTTGGAGGGEGGDGGNSGSPGSDAGVRYGGGGGGGNDGTGGDGNTFGGGGGGGEGSGGIGGAGGSYGGGGGGGYFADAGAGGFGGGSGGTGFAGNEATPGFGGGEGGATYVGGGGGSGYGGSIFVRDGGSLTVINATISGGAVTAGAGGSGVARDGANGLAAGTGIYLHGTSSVGFAPSVASTIADEIAGTGNLEMSGAATLTLSATNTYTGSTTISSGTLLVSGSIATSSLTSVASGATLGGNGSVGVVTVASGGNLSPGASAGILSTTNLTFIAGAHFRVELGGTAAGAGGYDQVHATGTVNLGGATLDTSVIGGFTLATAPGASYRIIDNLSQDPISGTFAGLAEGASVSIGGYSFAISYHGGDGNDVVLTAPASFAPPNLTEVVTALTSTTVAAGGSFSFAARTSNIGSGATTSGSTSRIFLSADPTIDAFDTVLQIRTVPTLGAFAEYAQNYIVNLPANLAPGTWYIGGLADFHNQVGESNEGDNNYNRLTITVTAAQPSPPPPAPDLRAVVTALTNTTVAAGGMFSFALNSVNEGSVASAGSTTRVFLSSDQIITGQDTVLAIQTVAPLNPGAGAAQNYLVNLPANLAPGTWYIGALADYHNQIGESNEANNNGNLLTITVPAPSLVENDTTSVATCWSGSQLTQAIAGSFSESAGSLTNSELYTMGNAPALMLAQPTTQV